MPAVNLQCQAETQVVSFISPQPILLNSSSEILLEGHDVWFAKDMPNSG